ncbi:hypothetical protein [Paractinoplanes globisporus]|uniref:DUF4179 domain-containing protein n=1 Tax=Paractinoplanes globisporus TaxID=113565 RepID=A0ABW6WMD9_9ACTN|nr:hypothetical protein [Actinoplanes globisporus]
MTNLIEEQLTEGMRERVAGITITTDLVGQTLRSQRRRTMVTRSAYAVGVVGLAGALAAGVLAAGDTGPEAPLDRPVAGAGSPQVRLAAAVSASQDISYRVKNTIVVRSQPGRPSMVVTGAFDPATTTGYLFFASGHARPWSEQRLVNGDLYTADLVHLQPVPSNPKGKPTPSIDQRVDWTHDPGKKYTNFVYDLKTGVLSLSADPHQLFDALTNSGAKISQTGPDRYHFEVAIPPRKGLTGGAMAGDVTVSSDKRIAKVVYQATQRFATETAVFDGTLELSDYGSPVTVERPSGTFEQLPGK